MKLEQQVTEIQRETFNKDTSFGIGDMRMVLSILRSKLYSNPIRTLIQEILTNARDANIESGSKNPVEVTLPTEDNLVLVIKDNGIGISPSRMYNVFIQYGASSKRDSDDQSGGFGIGAKSPFSYTDSFTITTVTTEHVIRMKRVYNAYIDESQLGKMIELYATKTDEPTGTTITIPVKKADMVTFLNRYFEIVKYWKVKPSCNEKHFENENHYFEDENIIIAQGREKIVLVDEIPYKIEYTNFNNSVSTYVENQFFNVIANNYKVIVKCTNAEITVSANREAIEYNDKNQLNINIKLEAGIENFKNLFMEEFLKQSSLLEASKFYWNYFHLIRNFIYPKTLQFNGRAIYPALFNVPGASIENWTINYDNKFQQTNLTSKLSAIKSGRLYIDDLDAHDRKDRRRFQTIEDQTNFNDIYVICPHKRPCFVNGRKLDIDCVDSYYVDWFLQNQDLLTELNVQYLSKITPKKMEIKKKEKVVGEFKVFKGDFDSIVSSYNTQNLESLLTHEAGNVVPVELYYLEMKSNKIRFNGVDLDVKKLELLRDVYLWPENQPARRVLFLNAKEQKQVKSQLEIKRFEELFMLHVSEIMSDPAIVELAKTPDYPTEVSGLSYQLESYKWASPEVMEYVSWRKAFDKNKKQVELIQKIANFLQIPDFKSTKEHDLVVKVIKKYPMVLCVDFGYNFDHKALNDYFKFINEGVQNEVCNINRYSQYHNSRV